MKSRVYIYSLFYHNMCLLQSCFCYLIEVPKRLTMLSIPYFMHDLLADHVSHNDSDDHDDKDDKDDDHSYVEEDNDDTEDEVGGGK